VQIAKLSELISNYPRKHTMTKREKEILIGRWQTPQGQQFAKQVIRALRRNRRLSKLGFLSQHEGRWDLRGITLPSWTEQSQLSVGGHLVSLGTGKMRFSKVMLNDVDLSYSNIDDSFWDKCHWENVIADSIQAKDFGAWLSTFQNVSFCKSDLTHASMGGAWGLSYNTFSAVNFSYSKLRHSVHQYEVYRNCDFSYADLKGVDFAGARFSDCKFAGVMDEVIFRLHSLTAPLPLFPWQKKIDVRQFANPMDNIDFSEAIFKYISLEGVDITNCQLPNDDSILVIRNQHAVFLKVREVIANEWTGEAQRIFLGILQDIYLTDRTSKQPIEIINKDYYREYVPEVGGQFVELLERITGEVNT